MSRTLDKPWIDETKGTVAERKSAAQIRAGIREMDQRGAERRARFKSGSLEAGTIAEESFDLYD